MVYFVEKRNCPLAHWGRFLGKRYRQESDVSRSAFNYGDGGKGYCENRPSMQLPHYRRFVLHGTRIGGEESGSEEGWRIRNPRKRSAQRPL